MQKSDIAAKAGHFDILKLLIGAGAQFLDQQTALHLAAANDTILSSHIP
jgi:ankyrin repeat protein